MTASGVVFRLVVITWPTETISYAETISTTLSAILSRDTSEASRGTKFEQPIPQMMPAAKGPEKPVFLPMGSYGKTVKLVAYIKGDTNYALWSPIIQGSLLYVSSSEYIELPVGTYWWVETNTISRKAGMASASNTGTLVGLWNHELTVIRSYRKGDQTLRT